MKINWSAMTLRCSFLLLLAAGGCWCAEVPATVVRPQPTDDVLVNPGMGIQTFQRYNGDPINAGQTWSEVGPESAKAESGAKPDFPKSSLAYLRWFWTQIEPEQGQYRWEVIDNALAAARSHGQKLDMRVMPYDERHPMPDWYRRSGARRANRDSDKDGAIWSPDASDPLYVRYWGELVRAMAQRYDGHPFLNSVDISTVGYWGEGWGPYLPDWSVQKALLDLYLENFHRTPLLVNFDQPEALAYAAEHGSGWRLDCWGDMGGWKGRTFAHMLDRYPEQIARTGVSEAWRRGPVSLESCWVPGFWYDRKWNVDYIMDQALRWHVSSVNIKSSAIPAEWKTKFEEFEKRMGYRLLLRKLEYPQAVHPGSMMAVSMWWLNAGVAPVYDPYTLALELRSGTRAAVIRTAADVRKWLPGDAVYDDTLYVPEDLPAGRYQVRLAVLDRRTGKPAVALAIQGRQPDGWYEMGTIDVR